MSDKIEEIANEIAEQTDTDILFINHPILRDLSCEVIQELCRRKLRKNVVLVLVTSGGDAHAAFRIARILQRKYKGEFHALIPGWCKSAGTLLVIGASKLYMEEMSELGPLDVQILKRDALGEYSSGLTVESAVQALQDLEYKLFDRFMKQIVRGSGVLLTFKTAAETAATLTLGIVQPIASKIEADRLGEDRRSMNIGKQYAHRLDMVSGILSKFDGSTEIVMNMLTTVYPSHGFVIDAEEASMLFSNKVEPYPESFRPLVAELGQKAIWPLGDDDPSKGEWRFLNGEPGDAEGDQLGENSPNGGETTGRTDASSIGDAEPEAPESPSGISGDVPEGP